MHALAAATLLGVPALCFTLGTGEHFLGPKLLAGETLALGAVLLAALTGADGPPSDWVWLPATGAAAVSAANAPNGWTAGLELVRMLALAATFAVFRRTPRPGRLTGVLLAAAALNAAIALAQAAGWRMGGVIAREGRHAVYGTFGNPNFLAEFLAPAAILAAGELTAAASAARAAAAAGLLPLLLGALLLTVSRAGWLGLMVGGLAAVLAGGRALRLAVLAQGTRRRAAWTVVACLAVAVACWRPLAVRIGSTLGGEDPGWLTRRFMWANALAQFEDHPWLGGGPAGYGERYLEVTIRLRRERGLRPVYPGITREAHHDGLQLLAERGVLGLLAWAAAFGWIAWGVARSLRAARDAERVRLGAAAGAAAAILAESCFGFPFRVFPTAALFLWCLARLAPRAAAPGFPAARWAPAALAAAGLWCAGRNACAQFALGTGLAAGAAGESALREGLRLAPGDGELHFRLGLALAGRGRGDEAGPEFEAALRLFHDPDAAFNLGQIALKQGRWADAAARYREGLEAYPDFNPAPYVDLASALVGLRRWAEARAAAERALAIDPGNVRALEVLRTMNR